MRQLHVLNAVQAKLGPAVAEVVRDPYARRWWAGPLLEELTLALLAVDGEALIRKVGTLAVFESVSAIVRPLFSVILAMAGSSPATLFSRFGLLSQSSIRHVQFEWFPRGPSAGTLVIVYPTPVPASYVEYWFGAIDLVYSETKRKGEPTRSSHSAGRLAFEVGWR
jgi:hypothetical protein